ncbi:hypothetical protein QAD02_012380 [Eretmocerus hayati]|uniref:Uncharacterized protein n=1 Tax=Eretmocerus hayati TaxID=131215 RepID=A0ACC2P0E4_9HYME|nr:hypothetical protein QAD02_012380 [Eretmocerus hayati]
MDLDIKITLPPSDSGHRSSSSSTLDRIECNIRMGYKILVLMRGLPGSGKSTIAKNIVQRTVQGELSNHILGTDDYWPIINHGIYKHDRSKVLQARTYNENRVLNAARQGWSPIIVDNTNINARKMEKYAIMVVEHGYIIGSLEPNTTWSRNISQLFLKNRHNTSKEVIQIMMDRYEPEISGKKLLQVLNSEYQPDQKPPQFRNRPPLPSKFDDKSSEMSTSKDTIESLDGGITSSSQGP